MFPKRVPVSISVYRDIHLANPVRFNVFRLHMYAFVSFSRPKLLTVSPVLTLQTLHKHNYELPERLYVITTVDSDCYGRLLVYSLGSLVCNFIVGILLLHTNFQGVVLRSMNAMERDLSHVLVVPSSVWKADARVHGLIELRWACPLLALVFFALFAFTPEMRTRYLQTLGKTRAHFSRSKESDFSS